MRELSGCMADVGITSCFGTVHDLSIYLALALALSRFLTRSQTLSHSHCPRRACALLLSPAEAVNVKDDGAKKREG